MAQPNPQPNAQPPRFWFDLAGAAPKVDIPNGGTIIEANQSSFPVLEGMAIFLLTLEPGAVRIPHWHPDAAEAQYVLSGQCRVGLISTAESQPSMWDFSYDLNPGMIGYVPQGWFHHIENTGDGPVTMLIIFDNPNPNDVDISWGFRITPPAMLQQVFGISFQGIDTRQVWISPPSQGSA